MFTGYIAEGADIDPYGVAEGMIVFGINGSKAVPEVIHTAVGFHGKDDGFSVGGAVHIKSFHFFAHAPERYGRETVHSLNIHAESEFFAFLNHPDRTEFGVFIGDHDGPHGDISVTGEEGIQIIFNAVIVAEVGVHTDDAGIKRRGSGVMLVGTGTEVFGNAFIPESHGGNKGFGIHLGYAHGIQRSAEVVEIDGFPCFIGQGRGEVRHIHFVDGGLDFKEIEFIPAFFKTPVYAGLIIQEAVIGVRMMNDDNSAVFMTGGDDVLRCGSTGIQQRFAGVIVDAQYAPMAPTGRDFRVAEEGDPQFFGEFRHFGVVDAGIMVGYNSEVQFRGDLSAEQVFDGGAAVAVIGMLMVIGAVPAFDLRIDLGGNIESIFHAFIGYIGGIRIRNGFIIHAVRSGEGNVFPFGHGKGNGKGIFIIKGIGEIGGAAQSFHFRGNAFDMNFEGNLEAVFVNGFQNDFRAVLKFEVFLRIAVKLNFFAGYGSITGRFDFEYIVIVAAVGSAVIEIALGQSEGIVPVFIGNIPEERLHIGNNFIGFHAVGFFGFRIGTVLFGDDISTGNGVAFGIQNLTIDGGAVIFGETVVAGDVAFHQGSGFRFAGNENFADEIIGFAGFEILQFVQIFVTGGAFVGIGFIYGEGYGVIGIVSGHKVAEVFVNAFGGADADTGHFGIGIEAVRTEHAGRSRCDGEAAVHGFIGYFIRFGVFHFAGQVDIISTVHQGVGDGDIQRFL